MWSASAPANIALIKYMGKENSANDPINPSFSYTLDHLRSAVSLEPYDSQKDKKDKWEPLHRGFDIENIKNFDIPRYLRFFEQLKQRYNITQTFIIRSANNFPSNCGLASSASSFAALTRCALTAFSDLAQYPLPSLETQAKLSQIGSGSSCRSFFSPWCVWTKNTINSIDLPLHYGNLIHIVILVDQEKKLISSSQAHQQVMTSDLFPTRSIRAEKRFTQLIAALKTSDWHKAYIIAWQEFWDMHALFETAAEPFSYMTPSSLEILRYARYYWYTHQDGPIITMDAGPNIHFLFRSDQKSQAMDFWQKFQQNYRLLTNMKIAHGVDNESIFHF